MNVPGYPYQRRRSDEDTAADWVSGRFVPNYPGFKVQILDGRGRVVHGRTLLANVRSSY